MQAKTGLFLLFSKHNDKYSKKLAISLKSVDGVLGVWTPGRQIGRHRRIHRTPRPAWPLAVDLGKGSFCCMDGVEYVTHKLWNSAKSFVIHWVVFYVIEVADNVFILSPT